MNTANKITITRIILSILIMLILVIPWYQFGITIPTILVGGKIIVEIHYMFAGIIFLIAALTDCVDGYLARKKNQITEFGQFMDAIADKILVNGVLIVLASTGFISVIIPVVVITRDTIVDGLRMIASNKGIVVPANILGKIKTVFMLAGIALMLFYNLPFELWNFYLADILIIIATTLSVVSGINYYFEVKDKVFKKK